MENINISLSEQYQTEKYACVECGSTTSLRNIEGYIHHNSKIHCLDYKTCKRNKRHGKYKRL